VLGMVDVEMIKQMKRHHSIREIARMTGWSRQTVRKHLAGAAQPPAYQIAKPRPRPVMGPYLDIITSWLEADESAPRKQRHTARRVFDRLVDEYGFTGSEITVRRAVARIRGKRIEAFVPLEAPWGRIGQADFGGAVVMIGNERREVALFCMRAKASKVPFVIALPSEKLEAFLAGHVAAFEFFGGVFGEVWYDNPKTAVTKILSGPHRIEHGRLSALRAHYLFDSSFCSPASGNEKGSVENLVGYVRRNALVPHTRSFSSMEALNVHLRGWCERERQRHAAEWAIESAALLDSAAPPVLSVCEQTGRGGQDLHGHGGPGALLGTGHLRGTYAASRELRRSGRGVRRLVACRTPCSQLRPQRHGPRAGPLSRRVRAQAQGRALLRRARERGPGVHDRARHGASHPRRSPYVRTSPAARA